MHLSALAALCALQASPPVATTWTQARGSADGTNRVQVEAIRNAPAKAWSVPFKKLESEPVLAGRVALVVGIAADRTERRLLAIDLDTGKKLPDAKLGDGAGARLAVWEAYVVVADTKGITILERWNGEFPVTKTRKIKGSFPEPPCVIDGLLFCVDASLSLHAIDLRTGQDKILRQDVGLGQTAAVRGKGSGTYEVATAGLLQGPNTKADAALGTRALSIDVVEYPSGTPIVEKSVRLGDAKDAIASGPDAYVAAIPPQEASGRVTWFAYSRTPVLSTKEAPFHSIMLPKWVTPVVTDAVVVEGGVVGFTQAGDLVAAARGGAAGMIRSHEKPFPDGALRAHVTGARNTIYFGNWAVDDRTGEVLWSDPSMQPATPLIPAADGMAIYGTERELVCVVDPQKGGASVPLAWKTLKAPQGTDGLVTRAGRWFEGPVETGSDGRVRLAAKSGATSVEAVDVALLLTGDRVVGRPIEAPVYRAFVAPLLAECTEGLAKLVADCREAGLVEMGRRLVTEGRRIASADARWDSLEQALSIRTAVEGNRAVGPTQRLQKSEAAARKVWVEGYRAGAAWCRAHGLSTCAAALLCDAETLLPGNEDVRKEAAALVPPGLDDPASGDASLRWMRLASALLPSGATVIGPDDPAWRTAKDEPWRKRAVGLRTDHLLMISTAEDAAAIGLCLQYAEGAARVLEQTLPVARSGASASAPPEPLNLRVHRDREEYMAQFSEGQRKVFEWTAGFYSRDDNISRFFVARDAHKDPLERPIQRVLVHELTHQYIAERVLGADGKTAWGAPKEPGFWIVEGFARFLEDQAQDFDSTPCGLDDAKAWSVDAAARLQEKGKLVPLASFVDLDHEGFFALGTEPVADIELHGTLGRVRANAKSIFYEEAGCLAFFLWNRAGEARRKALLDYLRGWHRNALEHESWKQLGYDDVAALQSDFDRFLAGETK